MPVMGQRSSSGEGHQARTEPPAAPSAWVQSRLAMAFKGEMWGVWLYFRRGHTAN